MRETKLLIGNDAVMLPLRSFCCWILNKLCDKCCSLCTSSKQTQWLADHFSIIIKNTSKEKGHIKDTEMKHVSLSKLGKGLLYFCLTISYITVDRIKDFQVPAAAHWGLVTIIRIGTFKHAFCDQGVQTRLSQFGVWSYATPKKKVIHNEGLKGSFLKACTSKSITISQAILQRLLKSAMTYCHLQPNGWSEAISKQFLHHNDPFMIYVIR